MQKSREGEREKNNNKERLGCLAQTRPPSHIYAALERKERQNESNNTIKGR